MTDPTETPRYDAIIDGLKNGELRLEPVFGRDGRLLFYALLPVGQPPPTEDRFPPVIDRDPRDPRRTKPL